jgi:transcription initiation factor TFIIB
VPGSFYGRGAAGYSVQVSATVGKQSGQCGECRAVLVLDFEKGEQVCGACGAVSRSDDLAFSAAYGSRSERSGSMSGDEDSSMMYYVSLPARIDSRDFDARGKHIVDVGDMNRLRRLNNMTIASDSNRRNLTKAASEIQRIGGSLAAGKGVVERAYEIYRKGIEEGSGRRRSIVGLAEAAVYLACKEGGVPRSAEEIEHTADLHERKSIRHYSKVLMKGAGLRMPSLDPASEVSRIASRAGLGGITERRAIQILEQVKYDSLLAGKRPISIAAAALYLAASQTSQYTTQIRIAFAAGITTITLRKRASEITGLLGTDLGLEIVPPPATV